MIHGSRQYFRRYRERSYEPWAFLRIARGSQLIARSFSIHLFTQYTQTTAMRKSITQFFLIAAAFLCTVPAMAQDTDPGGYMSAIGNAHVDMNQKYMAYMSAAAHGRRAKKVDKLRQQALNSILTGKDKTVQLSFYKGDNSLRQSSIDYIQLCYNVFNEDYSKIVNMEEIAEQSIDQMEAYILLQEKTTEKIKAANEKMNQASKDFAAKYNVKIIDSKNELDEKMEKANKVTHYVNQVYLVFFKANFQDAQLVKNMNDNKVNDIEQSRSALLKYATEGLTALDALRTFEGDGSMANSCRQLLLFYKKSAEKDVPKMLDFYLKKDNFEKLKKSMDSKTSHSKEEVDTYNAAVKDINNASNQFNQINANSNDTRKQLLQLWEDTEKNFGDAHMPYYK
jgi:predicted DNA-binding protein